MSEENYYFKDDLTQEEKKYVCKTLEEKFPEKKYFEGYYDASKLLIGEILSGYTFTKFKSNKKIENQGVEHFFIAKNDLNQTKYIRRQINLNLPNHSKYFWEIINQENFRQRKPEDKSEDLLEIINDLDDKKYQIINIESYFDDIKIEDDKLLVGLVGIQQRPIMQIIPINKPDKEGEYFWIKTINK